MDVSKQSDTPTRVLLIDVDNCPNQVGQLHELVKRFERVVAAYAGPSPKVPLSLVALLAESLADGSLELIGIERPRKNAADFALAFQAGRLAAEMPPDTEFVILSDDADLDNVVDLLDRQGFRVCRKKTAADNDLNGHVNYDVVWKQYYQGRLLNGSNSPRRRATLRRSIRSFFKSRPEIEPDRVIEQLVLFSIVGFDSSGEAAYDLSNSDDQPPQTDDRLLSKGG